jgi:hypothetical protein
MSGQPAQLPAHSPVKALGVFDGGGIVLAVNGKPFALLWNSLTRRQLECFFASDPDLLPSLFPHKSPRMRWSTSDARISILTACAKLGRVPSVLLYPMGMRRSANGRWYRHSASVREVPLSAFPGAQIIEFPDQTRARERGARRAEHPGWDAPPL